MLQCGVRAMSVLSGPAVGDFSCLYVNGIELPSILVLLFLYVGLVLCRSEMAGGAGRNDVMIRLFVSVQV